MPKLNKSTATQGFCEGFNQLKKFTEKELGNLESFEKDLKARKLKADTLITQGKLNPYDYNKKRLGTTEVRREKIFGEYVNSIGKYAKRLGKGFSPNADVNIELLEKLRKSSYNVMSTNLYFNRNFNWSQERTSLAAINKFRDMVASNDIAKYDYFIECFKKGVVEKDITLRQILESPLPKLREPELKDKEDLKAAIDKLADKLEKADSIIHRNSAEFNAMKDAVTSLKESLLNGKDDEIGACLEALQATSMIYVKAKGVGLQSSTMGQIRMDAALDLCNVSSKYMSCYASKERITEIENFEKENFSKKITKDGVLKFVSSEFYKTEEMEGLTDYYMNDPLKKLADNLKYIPEEEMDEAEMDAEFM